MMTNDDLAALLRRIEPLRACFVVEASSGALHGEFRRGPMAVEPEAVARAAAGLARAQTDIVGLAEPAGLCTLEWPDVTVIVRAISPAALVVFFFNAATNLGSARMHVAAVVDELGPMLPTPGRETVRSMPAASAPADASALQPGPSEPAALEAEPPQRGAAQKLLEYLDQNAPDTHAALLRVSLQTGLPLSLLKTPERLSEDEFEQVTASVRRILGVEQLPL